MGLPKVAEALALADDKIRPCLPGGHEDTQRGGVRETGHEQCPPSVRQFGQGPDVFDDTEEVGALDEHGRGAVIHQPPERLPVNLAGRVEGDLDALVPVCPGISPDNLSVLGVDRSRQDQSVPAEALGRKNRCLGHGRRPVVHGGVGHLGSRQPRDHGLVFIDRLQNSLADLRLVGRVGGVELRTRQNVAHDGGDVMVVGPGARQGCPGEPVACGQSAHVFPDFLFGKRRRQLEEPLQTVCLGDIGEERLQGADADCPHHLSCVVLGVRYVIHMPFPFWICGSVFFPGACRPRHASSAGLFSEDWL